MTEDTLLLRQIHPTFVQEDRPTSQAFRPSQKDRKALSVYNGDLISAAESWKVHVDEKRGESIGVLAVSVKECTEQSLTVKEDPAPFPEHTLICFNGLASREIRRKAKHLTLKARKRGWQHRAAPAS